MLGPVPFSDVGGLRGSRERGPRPGDVGGTRWVVVRVRHHGPRRLAHTRWVSVAGAGQVDAFPRRRARPPASEGCGARSRFVGLYEGVLLGKVGWPGVVVVDGWFRSRWFDAPRPVLWREEVITGCRIVPWLADGRCGNRVMCARRCVVAAVPLAGCGRQGTLVPRRVGRGGPTCS